MTHRVVEDVTYTRFYNDFRITIFKNVLSSFLYNEHNSPANFDNYSWCRLNELIKLGLWNHAALPVKTFQVPNEILFLFLVVLASFKLGVK